MSIPMVLKRGLCDLQVCVPKEYTDEQAEEFANKDCPTGIDSKWKLRAADDPHQLGDPIRVVCQARQEYVRIMLIC